MILPLEQIAIHPTAVLMEPGSVGPPQAMLNGLDVPLPCAPNLVGTDRRIQANAKANPVRRKRCEKFQRHPPSPDKQQHKATAEKEARGVRACGCFAFPC